jgi:hypothetical protein
MRRFILIDPCLGDRGSHPHHYCLDVLAAADRAGFACEAVVRREFPVNVGDWPKRFALDPVLDVPGYSKYTAFGELDTLAPDGRPRMRMVPPWASRHAERRRREHVAAFTRSIAAVVGRATAGDVVLLATASELDFAGLARAIRAAGVPPGIGWHVLFHYPLYRGFEPDFPRQEPRLDRLRHLFQEALDCVAPEPIHVHVTTAELAVHYARLGVTPVGVLPYPVRAVFREPRVAHGRPLRVVALGDARPEKGSQHLADVVARAGADPELSGRITFAIQSNAGFAPRARSAGDRAVLESLRRLAGMAKRSDASAPLVELLPGPLVEHSYMEQVAAADATILAYDQERYLARCSGVLLESLASGVVPLVTGGGSMGRMLAGPMRRHVAALLARSRPLAIERHGPVRTGRSRPWQIEIEPPSGGTALVVSLVWMATGPGALSAVPAVIEMKPAGAEPSAALVAADGGGLPTAAVFPLRSRPGRGGPLRLRMTPGGRAALLELAEVVVSVIDAGDHPAVSAAGIIIPPSADVAGALLQSLRELVTHADHYLTTAAAHAAEVAARFCGDRVVESLVAAGDARSQPSAELRC